MMESQSVGPSTHRRLPPGATACLLLLMLTALVLIAAPLATAAASAAPPTARGGDPLALLVLQQAELTASDAAIGDGFGDSVAVFGSTALVAADCKIVNGHNEAGAVYVYVRTGATWSQQAELSDPDAATQDWFGTSVALSGDTALVDAEGKTVNGQKAAGAVYVFTRTGTTWSQQTELADPDAAGNDVFGTSVALSGDTALVGDYNKTVAGQGSAGAAYVYTRTGTTWSQQAELTASDAACGDGLGISVALSGDTALVGAAWKTVSGQSYAGAVYVFKRTGTSWSQRAELSDPHAATKDAFGSSVALSGDSALVGASGKTVSGQSGAGAAYVYTRSGTTWSQQAELSASDAAVDDGLGSVVALSGDTALVGAGDKSVGGQSDAGAAYVYARAGTTWSQQTELSDPGATANDGFGWSVALSGETALVGAPNETVGSAGATGAAYVDLLPAPPSLSLKAKPISIKVGKTVTLSGTVKHFLASDKTVQIERQVGSKLTALKTLKLTNSGAFTWATKPNKTGTWVFEAAYKSGGVSYLSEPVSVKVHK